MARASEASTIAGSVGVRVLPVLTGFTKTLSQEATQAGATAGGQLGRAYGQAAAKAAGPSLSKLGADLGKARSAEADAAGKVRVAEAALADARARGGASTAAVVRAEEALAKATRGAQAAAETAKTAEQTYRQAQADRARATEAAAVGTERATRSWGLFRRGADDADQATRRMARGAGEAEQATGRLHRALSLAKTSAAALVAGAGLGAAVKVFSDTTSAAADLEQSVGAVDAVFKGNAAQMHAWASTAATDVGVAKNEFNELASVLGAQLKNAGTAMDDLGPQTKKLIGLGADLSSMFGGTTKDAIEAISSALKGEMDPIERYGISINDARIKAEAFAIGVAKPTVALDKVRVATIASDQAQKRYTEAVKKHGKESDEALRGEKSMLMAKAQLSKALEGQKVELDQHQKSLAIQSLLFKQSADAQGNFSRETDTAAHKQQVMNAKLEDSKARLGGMLLPARVFLVEGATKLLDWANRMGPAMSGAGRALAPVKDALTEARRAVTAFIASWQYNDGDVTSAGLPGKAEEAAFRLRRAWDAVLVWWRPTWAQLRDTAADGMALVSAVMDRARDAWRIWGGTVVQLFRDLLDGLGTMVRGALDVIQGIVRTVTAVLRGDWAQAWSGLGQIVSGAFRFILGALQVGTAALKAILSACWDAVTAAAGAAWDWVVGKLTDAWRSITGGVAAQTASWRKTITDAWAAVTGATSAAWDTVTGVVRDALAGVGRVISTGLTIALGICGAVLNLILHAFGTNLDAVIRVVSGAWRWVQDTTGSVWRAIAGFLTGWWRDQVAWATRNLQALRDLVGGAWSWISSRTQQVWGAISGWLTSTWRGISSFASQTTTQVKNAFSAAWSWVSDHTHRVWDGLTGYFGRTKDFLVRTIRDAVSGMSGAWEWIKDAFSGPAKWVHEHVLTPLVEGYNAVMKAVGKGGITLPAFRDGGVVSRYVAAAQQPRASLLRFNQGGPIPGRPAIGYDNLWGLLDGVEPIRVGSGEYIVNAARTMLTKPLLDLANFGPIDQVRALMDRFRGFAGGGRVQVNGRWLDADTWARIQRAQGMVGWSMPIMQGSWSNAVKASAGTHGGSGVADLGTGGHSWDAAVAALRAAGLIAWHRTPAQGFSHHIHLVNPAMAHAGMAQGAINQITSFLAGRNGLARGGRDDGPRGNAAELAKLAGDLRNAAGGGLDPAGWIKSVVGGAASWVVDKAKDAVTKVTEKFGSSPATQMAVGVASKAVEAVTQAVMAAATGQTGTPAGGDMGHGGAPDEVSVARWSSMVSRALAREHLPSSLLPLALHRMAVESSGNPRAINRSDINARRGTPSMGLFQVIGPTFARYRDPTLPNDPYDPEANTAAALRYVKADPKYRGDFRKAFGGVKGYQAGGVPARSVPQLLWDIRPGTTQKMPPGPSISWNLTGGEETLMRVDPRSGTPAAGVHIEHFEAHNSNAHEVLDELEHRLRVRRLNPVYAA